MPDYSNPKSLSSKQCRGSAPVPTPIIRATTGGCPYKMFESHSPELSAKIAQQIPQDFLELENRLQAFEAQYQRQSEDFYQQFRAGELGDSIDFFEWSVFYEMWKDGNQELKLFQAQGV
jgi:hypothetical protein